MTQTKFIETDIVGAGIGLRIPHVQQVLASNEQVVPWFELLVDNWLVDGGLNRRLLNEVSERYPTVFHGVGLSIGGSDPIDWNYLGNIRDLKQETGAIWYSEHLSFSGNKSYKIPDLLPLPYTQEAASHVVERIKQVQDFLGERVLIENVSTYLSCQYNEMNEAEFIKFVVEEADCLLLLDINNVFVTCKNLNQDMQQFLETIPVNRVKQIHLAGFADKGDFLLDAHNNPVDPKVWSAFEGFIEQHGAIASMIEWDNDLPSLPKLLEERSIAARILQHASHQNICSSIKHNAGINQCA